MAIVTDDIAPIIGVMTFFLYPW